MARPPIARKAPYTAGDPPAGRDRVEVLPHEFADFFELQQRLASTELGFPLRAAGETEGDIAATVMEMSALVAHILGLYQERYGNEAFLGTAASPASLLKHARRLAYEPSPGLSAHGHLALFAKDALAGTLPERFAFGSAALGETPPQDYELVEPAEIDGRLNVLTPADVTESILGGVASPLTLATLTLAGAELEIAVGDVVVVAWKVLNVQNFEARFATSITIDSERSETKMGLSSSVAVPYGVDVALLAKPAVDVHAFGHDAPVLFDTAFTNGLIAANATNARGYSAPPGLGANDLLLEQEVEASLAEQPIVRIDQNLTTYRLGGSGADPKQANVHAILRHVAPETVLPAPPNTIIHQLFPSVSIARSVTRLNLVDASNTPFPRPASLDRIGRYLSDWQLRTTVRTSRPSEATLSSPVELVGEHPSLLPGKLIIFDPILGQELSSDAQVARIDSASVAGGNTTLHFRPLDPSQALTPFPLGYLRILGNVARVSHGKTAVEVLGDSDGVTAFQRLRLSKVPVGHTLSFAGVEPQLEVRVAGQLFRRVLDFESSGPSDAVYLTERDEAGVVSVVFADGRRGAIPPSGKRHIHATYRKGIGLVGNAGAGAVHKITKAHPILERAYNPTPVVGGVEPASPEEVRTEAPLYVATFDRAVSVPDHAKLARRVPGVVRAKAFLGEVQPGVEGVHVVIANRQGVAENALGVTEFLRARRDNTLPLKVSGPGIVDIALAVGVWFDPAFDEELVKLDVRAFLTGLREKAPGRLTFAARDIEQPLFRSQITEWLETLPGIVAFRIEALSVVSGATNPVGVPPGVLDTVRAGPNEWIRLLPGNLTLSKKTEALS